MGCESCGSGANGKPSGCQSNGGCSTGGCNRMNVFDWLGDLPLHDGAKPYHILEVTFNQGSRKEFYRLSNTYMPLEKGQWIVVEGSPGFDMGQVSVTGELVKLQMKKHSVTEEETTRKIIRYATDEDYKLYQETKNREANLLTLSRAMARSMNLDMKIAEVDLQADGRKGTFYYTADHRVDFRELIKHYATDFHIKVEMRQIGARQESAKVGGIGSCGRELCCSTWLTDFKSVNTSAARYQNLSINQAKLSGQCGRLKCCLNYELDTYMDALRAFPTHADKIETAEGMATLQKRDIFRMLMWYSYQGSNTQYPVHIERVKEIIALNKVGEKPEDLGAVELEIPEAKKSLKVDMGFVNDVGQITLRSIEKGGRNNRRKGTQKEAVDVERAAPKSRETTRGNENRKRQGRPQPDVGADEAKTQRPPRKKPAKPKPAAAETSPEQSRGEREDTVAAKPHNPNRKPGKGRNKPKGPRPPKPTA